MQVCLRAGILERLGLIRSSSGNESKWRPVPVDYIQLLLPQLLRHEAEQPDAPGQVAEFRLRFIQQPVYLGAAHQGKCEKRQAAIFSDLKGKFTGITDPCHSSLNDRITCAV